jgi:hypothetical protein
VRPMRSASSRRGRPSTACARPAVRPTCS